MSINHLKLLQKSSFWLIAIASFLVFLYLSLILRLNTDFVTIIINVVAWFFIGAKIWENRQNLSFDSDIFSSAIALILIIFVSQRCLYSYRYEPIIQLLPFFGGLGLFLLASGFKQIKQFWLEILVLFIVSIPEGFVLDYIIDLATITAKFAGFILYRFGLQVSLQGHYIILPKGTVEVENGCSGIGSILLLWKIAILFLYKFRLVLKKQILIQSVAIGLGFIVNTIRVAIMAFLVTYSTQENFLYWHTGEGAQIFLFGSLLTLIIFCYFMIPEKES
jgi:cyanoexosortase A